MEIDLEMLQEYINEVDDYIQQIEPALLYLEDNPLDKSLIDECFRNIHSLKGAAGYMGFTNTSKLAHKMEELLDVVRSKSIPVDEDIISTLFAGVDRLKLLVKDVSQSQEESHEISDILKLIEEVIAKKERTQSEVSNKKESNRLNNDLDFASELSQVLSNSLKEVLESNELNVTEEDSETELMRLYEEQMGELITRLDTSLNADEIVVADVSKVLKEMKRLVNYIGAEDLLNRIKKALYLTEDKGDVLTARAAKEFRKRIQTLIEGKEFKEETNAQHENIVDQSKDNISKERELNLNVIEEEDEELYQIFLDFLKEQSPPLANVPDSLDLEWVNKCQESIKKIKSSANYMDYQDLVKLLDEWEERLTEILSVPNVEDNFNPHRLRELWDKMCEIVPGLKELDLSTLEKEQGGITEEVKSSEEAVERALDELFSDVTTPTSKPISKEDIISTPSPKKISPPKDMLRSNSAEKENLDTDEFSRVSISKSGDSFNVTSAISGTSNLSDITSTITHSVRVDLDKLEDLMDGVGELVVLRAGISRVAGQLKLFYQRLLDSGTLPPKDLRPLRSMIYRLQEQTEGFSGAVHRMQDIVMRLRMLPIGQLFNRYNRLVRDLSHRLGKEVSLVLEGSETSLDKRVLEEIAEPIAHIIRNALDHGIELPDIRAKLGKPKKGVISLKAFQEGNYVYISISDDGKGLDREALLAKAVTMGFISQQQASNIDTEQVWELIFTPGMSTALEVSDTSGRGVGLDVVKRAIERLGGEIKVSSSPGRGTSFLLKIPLTLAIIQAMVIRVGSQMMAIPMSCVEETVRFPVSKVSNIEGFELISVRQDTLPLIRLNKIFKFPHDKAQPSNQRHIFAAIVKKGEYKVALAVDALMGQQEVVIKPLSDYLTEQPGFSGATLLADGSIALVLDVSAVLERAKAFRHIEQQMWLKSKLAIDGIKESSHLSF